MKELIFKITKDELKNFLTIVKELVKIYDNFKIIFSDEGILFYTILGEESSGKINVLKVFHFEQGKLFSEFPKKLNLNMTFKEGKKFYDSMNFLSDTESEEIDITINYNKDNFVYTFGGKNEFLEIRAICQTNNNIKDLTFDILKERLNSDYSEWSFEVSNEQLTKILKLIKLDLVNKILNIRVDDGDIIFSETQWDLKINKTDVSRRINLNIKKEFFKYIVNDISKESFTISVFPSYIVINETKSHLMFSMDLAD